MTNHSTVLQFDDTTDDVNRVLSNLNEAVILHYTGVICLTYVEKSKKATLKVNFLWITLQVNTGPNQYDWCFKWKRNFILRACSCRRLRSSVFALTGAHFRRLVTSRWWCGLAKNQSWTKQSSEILNLNLQL